MENLENINFEIKLAGVELLENKMEEVRSPFPKGYTFNYNIKVELKHSIDIKITVAITSVDILSDDSQTKFASIKTACIFQIPNITNYLDETTHQIELPVVTNQMLSSIAISTTRGIMFAEFRGTGLHHAFLPIIDPKQLK